MGLLDDIRDDLIGQSTNVASTLRKAMVLSHDFQSPELREWVGFELNGYPDSVQLPTYRQLTLPLAGIFHGPFHSRMTDVTISAAGLPQQAREFAHSLPVREGIAALEETLASGENEFHRTLPVEVTALPRESTQMTGGYELSEAYQRIPRHILAGVLDSVQNRLLEFVLELKGLEAASDSGNNDNVEPEAVRNAVNITIYGNNNIVAGGENIRQEIAPVQQGDLDSLVAHLRSHQVPDEDIQELQNAVSSEPDAVNGEPGPNVKAWIGGMVAKAVSGAWQITTERASVLLANAINTYYGI